MTTANADDVKINNPKESNKMSSKTNSTNLIELYEDQETYLIGCCLYCGDVQVAGGRLARSAVRELLAMDTEPYPTGLFVISDISLLILIDRIESDPHKEIEELEKGGGDIRSLKALLVTGYSKLENVLGVNTPEQIRALIQSIQCENAVLERMALNDVPF